MEQPQSLSFAVIGHIRTDLPEKFGLPRQSGLVEELTGTVVLEKPYRSPEALRGIEGYSHLWLLWVFSEAADKGWSPTVRPPRLGGNRRMGVFASRSPFRPNPIGMSAVRLLGIDRDAADGPLLQVAGIDMMDGTPILDIKPYLPFTDAIPAAAAGFSLPPDQGLLEVELPEPLSALLPEDKRAALIALLRQDPRPQYQEDGARVYGMSFAGREVRFTVEKGICRVVEIL
ncbi:MAG: tRNA (N6-threonylcarbamoyladenosine(37)-N6)-methyltransferase TrmO [Clostridia bacterium]|nr:tRNA (N6-threonylcarbamoyladenosine(37)-N6)-methyltransferase TrmO [Clostridia bacterium]